jgi:WD40 repeat protein
MGKSIQNLLLSTLLILLMLNMAEAKSIATPCVIDVETIVAIDWHPNGEIVAFGSNCGVLFFDANLDHLMNVLPLQVSYDVWFVSSVAFNPDGSMIAASTLSHAHDADTRIWDIATSELLQIVPFSGVPIEWHPTEDVIAISRGITVQVVDVQLGSVIFEYAVPEEHSPNNVPYAALICWSPQGSYFRTFFAFTSYIITFPTWEVIHYRNSLLPGSDCNEDLTLAASSGAAIDTLYDFRFVVAEEACNGGGAAWNHNEETEFAVNCDDNTVRVFDRDVQLVAMLEGDFDGRQLLAFGRSIRYSPDGERLIALGNSGFVRIWDTANYTLIKRVNLVDVANAALAENQVILTSILTPFVEEAARGG